MTTCRSNCARCRTRCRCGGCRDNPKTSSLPPKTVRDALASQAEEPGFNYAMLEFAFGDLGHDREVASLELFANAVMPALRDL